MRDENRNVQSKQNPLAIRSTRLYVACDTIIPGAKNFHYLELVYLLCLAFLSNTLAEFLMTELSLHLPMCPLTID